MEGGGSGLATAIADTLSTVMSSITTISANPLVLTAFAVPVTGAVIGLCKRLFKRK